VSGAALASVVSAGAAVLGTIMSVLLLSFRVGSLVGEVRGFMASSQADRQALHAENATIEAKLDTHIANHTQGRR
jgi:hypothetical protein